MKSLRFRILAIFLGVFLCSSFATWQVSEHIAWQLGHDFLDGSMRLELQQSVETYEAGGSVKLQHYLAETDAALQGRRYLLDANGRDLVSGADRSRSLSAESSQPVKPYLIDGQFRIAMPSPDRKYHLVIVVPPPIATVRFIPYFVLLTLAIAFLGWFFSVGIVSPLHRVAAIVELFGKGNLKARVGSKRKDEIGDLGRSFDSMADRIETLLTAERRLLEDVSHELRSPLARLSFAAELMRGAANPEQALDRMRREIVRLSELVDNLLEITRMEGDPSSRVTQSFSFSILLQEILGDCAFEAEARNIETVSRIDDSLTMDGNSELVRRAIENVLRNAIRFSPQYSLIQTDAVHEEENIIVTVRDSGPGVPEDLLTAIFDPFVRADTSRDSSSGGGVGLGLSIARRAVMLHRGTIGARNLHPGLQVTIVLPASKS